MSTSGGTRQSTSRQGARRSGGTIPMPAGIRAKQEAERAARRAKQDAAQAKSMARSAAPGKTVAAQARAQQNAEMTREYNIAKGMRTRDARGLMLVPTADGKYRVFGPDAEVVGKALHRKPGDFATGAFDVDAEHGEIVRERIAALTLSQADLDSVFGELTARGYGITRLVYDTGHTERVGARVQALAAARPVDVTSIARSRRGQTASPARMAMTQYAKGLQKRIAQLEQQAVPKAATKAPAKKGTSKATSKTATAAPKKLTAKDRRELASSRVQMAYLARAHVRTGLDAERRLLALREKNTVMPGETRAPKRSQANRDARLALRAALNGAAIRAAEKMKPTTARFLGRQVRELVSILAEGTARRGERAQIRRQIAVIDAHLRRADTLYAIHHGRGASVNRYSSVAETAMSGK